MPGSTPRRRQGGVRSAADTSTSAGAHTLSCFGLACSAYEPAQSGRLLQGRRVQAPPLIVAGGDNSSNRDQASVPLFVDGPPLVKGQLRGGLVEP
jgi:hypothetical protein